MTKTDNDVCRPRTPLFTVGVILTGLHALGGWITGALLFAIGRGYLAGPREWLEAQDFFLIDLILTGAGVVGALFILVSTVQLLACAGAWGGSRGWTWTLLVFSVLGAVGSGPVSLMIAAVTVVGAAQVLDQSRPFSEPVQ